VANPRIPSATVTRLVRYLRALEDLDQRGVERVSSEQLAEAAGVTAFQVRKDLSYFGSYGTRGVGYAVPFLKRELRQILGLDRRWRLAIVGMGRLGQALADYPGFGERFALVGFFDIDPAKIGQRVGAGVIEPLAALPQAVRARAIEIGLVTVPREAAQEVVNRLVQAGVRGILNFAPAVVETPPGVWVESVDFLAGLARLTYFVTQEVEGEWI